MEHEPSDSVMNSGSRLHRWEPNIHAPGTVSNDQFKGDNCLEEYLEAIEAALPPSEPCKKEHADCGFNWIADENGGAQI